VLGRGVAGLSSPFDDTPYGDACGGAAQELIYVRHTKWGAVLRRLTACAVLSLGLSLAACGTTVPLTQTPPGAQPGSGVDVGPGQVPTDGGNATVAPQASGEPTSVGGTTGSAGGVPGGTSGSGATGGTDGTGALAVQGRGVTAKTITIGAAIPTGTEAAGKALGISGAGAIAEEDIWEAVLADVNRSGGVLGRTLVLHNHSIDLATFVANPAQTYAEICADFRDDHKVFAAMMYIADPTLRRCFAQMGSPFVVYGSITMAPAAAYGEHGGSFLYGPSSITQERMSELFVQSLLARSFTQKWDINNGGPGIAPVKLGLIHADKPDQNNLYAAQTRELAKRGWKFSDKVTYSAEDASTALAGTRSAVLKFRAQGISHVFGASGFFLQYAESQNYRPRYAYLPGLGSIGAANVPARQMRGALTVGWSPAQDVNAAEDPGDNPGSARCRDVMRSAGLPPGNRTDVKLMYAVCDAVYSFRAAVEAGGEASVAGLRRGYEALGTRFGPALTFTSSFGPSRHYGVSSVRDMHYDSSCSCLKYSSRTNRS